MDNQVNQATVGRLIKYRTYLHKPIKRRCIWKPAAKINYNVKRLYITPKDHNFDGSDPIKVLLLLIEPNRECIKLAVTEGQAYVSLYYMKKLTDTEPFTSVKR